MAISIRADEAEKVSTLLSIRVKEEQAIAEKNLLAERERSASELDRVRGELQTAQARIDTLSARECRRTGKLALEHLQRGAELATRCAQELLERQQALKTCVRMYQDLESVYDKH